MAKSNYNIIIQNSKTSKTNFVGNVKKIGFRSGQNGIKNIYLDLYEEDNTKTSIAFFTDGENAIKFFINDKLIWKNTVN